MPAIAENLPLADSVLNAWTANFTRLEAFQSARAALAALLRDAGARRIWLPAYICTSLFEGAKASGATVRFYRLDDGLEPDAAGLSREIAAGDAVLGVDYFGFAAPAFCDLRRRFDDLLWIEDRAQALEPGPAWGEVLIYSPRKLLGVADGGLLVANQPLPRPALPAKPDLWAPEEARARDPEGRSPESWYPLFGAREAGLGPSPAAATSRTLRALSSTLMAPESSARRANWRQLAEGLADLALRPERELDVAPLAFPIVVEDAQGLQGALARERIWAPRHWAELPNEAGDFPGEHALAQRLLSLPCDPRYGPADMARLIEAVLRLAQPQPR